MNEKHADQRHCFFFANVRCLFDSNYVRRQNCSRHLKTIDLTELIEGHGMEIVILSMKLMLIKKIEDI